VIIADVLAVYGNHGVRLYPFRKKAGETGIGGDEKKAFPVFS
jgi:hypothetical protein